MAGTNYYANVEGKNIATVEPYLGKGQSYTANLQSAFPGSPIHSGEITTDERKATFQSGEYSSLDGEVLNGNGFASFNRDYSAHPNVPDILNLDIESLNIPSPYMPNPTSPGAGSFDASDKPAFEGNVKDPLLVNAQFGAGSNSTYNPAISSQKLSDLNLGSYLPGKSGGGSNS